MRTIYRRFASVLAITALAAALAAAPASAAPSNAPNAVVVSLDCGAGGAFDVVVNGSGAWAPGHVVGGAGIVIPLAFGEETTTVRDPEGNVVAEETRPAMTKGRASARGRERLSCTYSATFEDDGLTITIAGSATGFIAGRSA